MGLIGFGYVFGLELGGVEWRRAKMVCGRRVEWRRVVCKVSVRGESVKGLLSENVVDKGFGEERKRVELWEGEKDGDGREEDVEEKKKRANEARREKMKALWSDAEWREKVLKKRRGRRAVKKQAKSLSKRWSDKEYKERLSKSLKGKTPWNKGVPHTEETRRKIAMTHRGVEKSAETRKKMSEAKMSTSRDAKWRESISRGKRGKTKEFFQMKRQYDALLADLRLWSESHRMRTGRSPRAETIDTIVTLPHLLHKLKRYLALKSKLQEFDSIYEHDDPILR